MIHCINDLGKQDIVKYRVALSNIAPYTTLEKLQEILQFMFPTTILDIQSLTQEAEGAPMQATVFCDSQTEAIIIKTYLDKLPFNGHAMDAFLIGYSTPSSEINQKLFDNQSFNFVECSNADQKSNFKDQVNHGQSCQMKSAKLDSNSIQAQIMQFRKSQILPKSDDLMTRNDIIFRETDTCIEAKIKQIRESHSIGKRSNTFSESDYMNQGAVKKFRDSNFQDTFNKSSHFDKQVSSSYTLTDYEIWRSKNEFGDSNFRKLTLLKDFRGQNFPNEGSFRKLYEYDITNQGTKNASNQSDFKHGDRPILFDKSIGKQGSLNEYDDDKYAEFNFRNQEFNLFRQSDQLNGRPSDSRESNFQKPASDPCESAYSNQANLNSFLRSNFPNKGFNEWRRYDSTNQGSRTDNFGKDIPSYEFTESDLEKQSSMNEFSESTFHCQAPSNNFKGSHIGPSGSAGWRRSNESYNPNITNEDRLFNRRESTLVNKETDMARQRNLPNQGRSEEYYQTKFDNNQSSSQVFRQNPEKQERSPSNNRNYIGKTRSTRDNEKESFVKSAKTVVTQEIKKKSPHRSEKPVPLPKTSVHTKRKSDIKGGPPKKLPLEELGQQKLIEQAILVLAKQHEEALKKLRIYKGIWEGCLEFAKEEISDKLHKLIGDSRLGSYEDAVVIYRKSVPLQKDQAIISEARRRLGTRVFKPEPFGRYIDIREEVGLRQALEIEALNDQYSLISNLADDSCWYVDYQLDKILSKVYKQNALKPGEEDPFKGVTFDDLKQKVMSDEERPALERFIDQRLARLVPNIKNYMEMETICSVKHSFWLVPMLNDRVVEIGVNNLPHKKSQRELHYVTMVSEAPSLRQLMKPYQIATVWLMRSNTHRGALLALTDGMQYEDLLARNGCIVDGKKVLIYPTEEFKPDLTLDEISDDEEELIKDLGDSRDSRESSYDSISISSYSSRALSPYYTREMGMPDSPRSSFSDIIILDDTDIIEID